MADGPPEIPYGYCQCGCGEKTSIPIRTSTRDRQFKGQPMRFRSGHHTRKFRPDYVVDSEGCWIWQWRRDGLGYGRTNRGGRDGRLAYRWYYEQRHGPLPVEIGLHHTCRNPPCVNPDHLEPVTTAEHGRRHSRLSDAQVQDIRESAEPSRVLALRHGIHPSYAGEIRRKAA